MRFNVRTCRNSELSTVGRRLVLRRKDSILAPSSSRLTFSQGRVAVLLIEGRTAREISELLGISLSTVRAHLRALHQKADRHSFSALIQWCWSNLKTEIVPALAREPEWAQRADDLLINR